MTEIDEKATLRQHIKDLTGRMVNALGAEEFKDIRDALGSVLDVYKTLHSTDGFQNDTRGTALVAYGKAFSNGAPARKRGRNPGRAGRARAANGSTAGPTGTA